MNHKFSCCKFFSLLIVLSVVFPFMGCKNKDSLKAGNKINPKKTATIGFSLDTLVIERWQRDCEIFINTAKNQGAEIIFQNANNDENKQAEQIKYLIDLNVDCLVVIAKKSEPLVEVLQKARAKNIPVISYDRLIRDAPVSMYISVNSESVGTQTANLFEEYYSPQRYICIFGSPDDFNMHLFRQGVDKIIDAEKIIYTYFTPEWNYDDAYSEMNVLLDSFYSPDAVICGNDAIAEKVISALQEHQMGNIPVAGQDADIAACRRVVNGIQFATVYKPIDTLARTTATYAVNLAKGIKVDDLTRNFETINNGYQNVPVVWLEPSIVTKDNMESVVIKSSFHNYSEIFD